MNQLLQTRSSSPRSILSQGQSILLHFFRQTTDFHRWHEHDPIEIVASVERCISEAVKAFEQQGWHATQINAIGITNQRETTVLWDHDTGPPLHNAIDWTDTRTQHLIRELKSRPGAEKLQDLCGLPLSTYPSVGKLLWLIQND